MTEDHDSDRSFSSPDSISAEVAGEKEPNGDGSDSQRTETVLLNSLDGIVSDRDSVLEDDESERLLRDVYRAVTTPSTRNTIGSTLDKVAERSQRSKGGNSSGDADEGSLATTIADIATKLDSRGLELQIDHEVPISFVPEFVAVHRFFHTRELGDLHPMTEDDAMAPALERAVAAVEKEDFETAAAAFGEAIDKNSDVTSGVAVRVLRAWADHRAGDDESGVERVKEVLRRDQDAWPARLVGVAAAHSNPEWFREGKLASEAYLRVRTETSTTASFDAAVVDNSGTERWLDGTPNCFLANELPAEGRLRLRLRGPPGELPPLHAYYLAVGVVEPESAQPRTVEQILLDGPVTADATEQVRIRTP